MSLLFATLGGHVSESAAAALQQCQYIGISFCNHETVFTSPFYMGAIAIEHHVWRTMRGGVYSGTHGNRSADRARMVIPMPARCRAWLTSNTSAVSASACGRASRRVEDVYGSYAVWAGGTKSQSSSDQPFSRANGGVGCSAGEDDTAGQRSPLRDEDDP